MESTDFSLTELDLNMNIFNVHAEILLNDLLMSNESLYVEWKDPQVESDWSTKDIQQIINHYGFGHILGNILHGLSLSPLIENNTLLGFIDIEDKKVAKKFIKQAFSEELFDAGLETVTSMVRRGLPASEADDFEDFEGEDLYLDENDDDLESLSALLQVLYDKLPDLIAILCKDNEPQQTSSGKIRFFGPRKLKILDLIIALMDEEGSIVINERLLELNLPRIILDLLVKYPRHSILHKHIQLYIRVSLRTDTLRINLFEESGILDFLVEHCEEQWAKPISERESFSGFLALIVDDILAFEFDEQVADFLEEHPTFNDFVDTTFVNYKAESVYSINP